MKFRIAKFISVVTVVPLIALYALTAVYLHDPDVFGGTLWYLLSVAFLTFLPLSAYALEHVIPAIRRQGRDGERKLAFIMGVAGYVLGTAASFLFRAPHGVKMIFLSYLSSGVLLSVVNAAVRLKASGHACGVSGPYVFLLYFLGTGVWPLVFLLVPVFWARVSMGRHTYRELISGTAVGMASTALTIAVYAAVAL